MENNIELTGDDVENIIFSVKCARVNAKFFGNANDFVVWSYKFEKLMNEKNAESAQEKRKEVSKSKEPDIQPVELTKGMYGDLSYDKNKVGEVYEGKNQWHDC